MIFSPVDSTIISKFNLYFHGGTDNYYRKNTRLFFVYKPEPTVMYFWIKRLLAMTADNVEMRNPDVLYINRSMKNNQNS